MRKRSIDPDGELALRVIAPDADGQPPDAVFHDWIASLMETAAGLAASARALGPVATAAVSNVSLLHPVETGDVVCVYTRITKLGHTSITVGVEAFALRHYLQERVRLTEAEYVVVAVDDEGLPRTLPTSDWAFGALG